jgi:hypothetical protein
MDDTAARREPWAVLAYTVADDRGGASALDAAAQRELKAIGDAADVGGVSVAAQVDFKRPKGVFRGTLTARPRAIARGFTDVRAERHPLWQKILGDIDEDRSELRIQANPDDLSAARANVLQAFLAYGRESCPADRYMIYFYGHAYGPMGLFCDRETGQRETDTLRLNDLAGTIHAGGRAAIILFRDCFMNTLEAAYQLREAAAFMIATQALAPIAGVWPWDDFMRALEPAAAAAAVARKVAMRLAAFLEEPGNRAPFAEVPYAVLDLDHAGAVAAPLRRLADALEAARQDPVRAAACAEALEGARVGSPTDPSNPGDPALVDVPTLCERLGALRGDSVAAAARALDEVVTGRLVGWRHSRRGRFRGTSLFYKPVTARDRRRSYLQAEDETVAAADAGYYRTLALCRATGWDRVALDPLSVRSEK